MDNQKKLFINNNADEKQVKLITYISNELVNALIILKV
jgi:hypothetical protein